MYIGRTAQTRFNIPFNPNFHSVCNIKQRLEKATLLKCIVLGIIDKGQMFDKFLYEMLDGTIHDLVPD